MRIAVLITYHNERELLSRCLNSIKAQSVPVDEIWVYDDASEYPAADYIPQSCDVEIIRGEENRGPSFGRNVLLESTGCEYVHFHDADDLFQPHWCRSVKEAIEKSPVDAVFTEVSSIRRGKPVVEQVLGLQPLISGEDIIRFCIRGVMLVPAGTYLRAVALKIGGYRTDLPQSEDYDYHLRLLAEGIRYSVVTESLVVIDLRENSRSADQITCWASVAAAIASLHQRFPSEYLPEFVERLASIGCSLLRVQAYAEAERALRLASDLGRPTFRNERPVFRILATLFGPRNAERVAATYRRTLPEAARAWAVRRSM